MQLLQDETGNGPVERSPQTHYKHILRNAINLKNRRNGLQPRLTETLLFPTQVSSSLITSDDIRFNDVTNCPRTCRLDVTRPTSCWSCRAAITAVTVNSRANLGAPTYSRNRGWWSCSPYAGSTSATSALSYDVIRYGQPGSHRVSAGCPLCLMWCRVHQKAPPGTSTSIQL